MSYVLAAGASFVFIFLRAFQQLNVVHNKYLAVMPTSFFMACCEVYIISAIAIKGWDPLLVLAVSLGGGSGCMVSMFIHQRIFKRNEQTFKS